MGVNNYIWRNSFIHKINPIIKFLVFIFFVVLIFMKQGFLIQIIIFSLVIIIFLIAKLPKKLLVKIFITYLFMFSLLFLINWLTQKSPLAFNEKIFGDYKVIGTPPAVFDNLNKNYAIAGDIWGGKLVTDTDQNNLAKIFANENELKKFAQTLSFINNGQFSIDQLRTIKFSDGTVIGYFVKWYALTSQSFVTSVWISNKILIVILASTILTATTSTIELTYALEDMLTPLKVFKLPVNEMAMMISISLRFIPSLINESFRIMNAQASRGIDFKNGNIFTKMFSLVSLIIPLFTIAFLKADDLANAMSARAYNPRYPRTRYRTFSLHSADLFSFLFIMVLLTVLFVMSFSKIYFAWFSISEALTVFGI